MIDTKPKFLISGTDSGVMAPAHATVVSRRRKFLMPSTCSVVTCWASTGTATVDISASKPAAVSIRRRMTLSPLGLLDFKDHSWVIVVQDPSKPLSALGGTVYRRRRRRLDQASAWRRGFRWWW